MTSYIVYVTIIKDNEPITYQVSPVAATKTLVISKFTGSVKDGVSKQYEIKQLPNGEVICTCPGFKHLKEKNATSRCKHFEVLKHFTSFCNDVFQTTGVRVK